jgi:DNA-binding transcriptional regulator/RsmH inhibitor MraZ
MRKAKVTQELANGFPEWTKVRMDEQSIGHSFLNVIGLQIEDLITETFRAVKNLFLTTATVGEIDQVYRFTLPNYFEFDVDSVNSLDPGPLAPTISGLVGVTWYPVSEVDNGSIKSLWYDAVPTRLAEIEQFSISGYLVASGTSNDISLTTYSGVVIDNRLTVVTDGYQLIQVNEDNELQKSRIRIEGTTWKDTSESEDTIFLFAESKQTNKAWTSIDRIAPIDFVSDSNILVYSHQFNQPYYIDSFDTITQYTTSRENLPIFWSLDVSPSGYSTLQAQHYSVNRAVDLLRVRPELVEFQNWELLDSNSNPITANDITVVPNEQRILAITNDKLLIYNTFFELPDLKELRDSSVNALIGVETSSDYIIRGEDIEITCLFKRPIKTVTRHRLKVEYPDGEELGILLDGSLVSVATNYWIVDETSDKFIRQPLILELSDFGQHLITLEVTYLDGTSEIAQRAVLVQNKMPLSELSLTSITTNAVGIDIDHQNRILILDGSNMVHSIKLYSDLVIIDYDTKELIFREAYDEVKVVK